MSGRDLAYMSIQELTRLASPLAGSLLPIFNPANNRASSIDISNLIPGKPYIYPESYGSGPVGGAFGDTNGVVTGGIYLETTSHLFNKSDIGKICVVALAERSIVGVLDGKAVLSSAVSNGTGLRWFCGYDDTNAIHSALLAARAKTTNYASGTTQDTSSFGMIATGGTVLLSGFYLVRNTQARYDAGNWGAVTVPKRVGMRGIGMAQSGIVCLGGNVGNVIANENADVSNGGWDDFMQLQDFSVFCNKDLQTSAALDGVHFKAAFNNYVKTDNFMAMSNIRVFEPKRDGFLISGRGEGVYFNLMSVYSDNFGVNLDGYVDSRFYSVNAGGSQKTGIRINRSANISMYGCKSFYSGAAGGSNAKDSANWVLTADSYLNGQVNLNGCEAQESRGSGFYIDSGLNVLNGCTAQDPGRAALIGGTPPSIRAGYHIADINTSNANAKHNVFNGCHARPALTLDYNDPASTTTMGYGTHAVYLDPTTKDNIGDIYTFSQATYATAKIGGAGATNGRNTLLQIDRVALT